MLIDEWLILASKKISRNDAELILSHILKRDLTYLAIHGNEKLDRKIIKTANYQLRQRSSGLPLAYIFHQKDFYNRSFYVDKRVLIPRPETETIVDIIKSKNEDDLKILDLGTGSGCLAITLALEINNSTVIATDISKKALNVARKNAKNLKANIKLIQSDLLSIYKNKSPRFDYIVTNLPYVGKDWPWLDHESLAHEPSLALFSEPDTALYIKFLSEISKNSGILSENGSILLEADPSEHQKIIETANSLFKNINVIVDNFIVEIKFS